MNKINIQENHASPYKPKNHFNQYSLDDIEDKFMKDVVISSKPSYQYEEMYLSKLEQGEKTYEQYKKGAIPLSKFDKILKRKEPLDNDLNYNKVEKLKKQYIYEYIESQTHSFQKQQQDSKVFQKKNKKLNFFFSDPDTIEEIAIDAAYHNELQEQSQQDNELNDHQEQTQKFKLKAKVDTHSQGIQLFFVYKDQEYKLEREFPGNVFIEVRYGDKVGLFKKDDFSYIPIDLELQQQQQQQSINKNESIESNNYQIVLESKHLITDQQDDRSEISTRSKAYSISSHHTKHLQYRKRNYQSKNITTNYLTPYKQFNNNSSSKNTSYISTASQKRY